MGRETAPEIWMEGTMPVTNVRSSWVGGCLSFLQANTTDGQVLFGQDDTGLDVKGFGATTGKYFMWDESADTFYVVGTFSHTGDEAITGSLTVTKTGLGVTDGRVVKFVGTVAAPAHADGYGAVETDITASGTFAGPYVAASSTWLNLLAAAVPGTSIITPHNDGIYVPSGITASSAKMIMGGRYHYMADDGANPGSLFLFSTNIYSNALTALLDVNAIEDFGGASGAATGNDYKIPFVKIASTGVVWYINLYHA
jgi:hypothetical protein